MLVDFGVEYGFLDCKGMISSLVQLWYAIVTAIVKVFGYFADMMNIAFYIFAGVDISSTTNGTSGAYDITVNGQKKNILDYFVFSDTMTKAYLWLSLAGLVLIVIFTIYRIIKQDYFDKAGPRSKGPIFRNVAISCISFLLVIPIFYLIIHTSSLLAVVVMDAMGMNANQFAGAKVFQLTWSDSGELVRYVNKALTGYEYGSDKAVETICLLNENLHNQTLFTVLADAQHVQRSPHIGLALGGWGGWSSGRIAVIDNNGVTLNPPTFYWYLYFVGIVITIKALYKLLLAMLQRIFKLMGLFLVAPSPISQYVLDDGQKYKSWLSQSIQEGLRLVVAVMSFSIFLIALNLIGQVDFYSAFVSAQEAAKEQATASLYNVNVELLSEGTSIAAQQTGTSSTLFQEMINAFMRIFMLIGAGGAITDLDGVLSPLISGAKSSLDAGETGKAADSVVGAVKSVAAASIGGMAGAMGVNIQQAWKHRNASAEAKEQGEKEAKKDSKKASDETEKPEGGTSSPGGAGGSGGPGGSGGAGGAGGVGAPNEAESPDESDVGKGPEGNDSEGDDSDEGGAGGTASPDNTIEEAENGPEPKTKMFSAIRQKAKDVSDFGDNIKEKVGNAANKVKEGVNNVADKIANSTPFVKAKDLAEKAKEGMDKRAEKRAENYNKVKGKIADHLDDAKALGKDIANSKFGKGVASAGRVVGRGAKAIGGAAWQTAKAAGSAVGSTVGTVGSVVGRSVFEGLKKGASVAGKEMLSGVVGKDTAKMFLDTRKDSAKSAEASAKARAAKKYEATKDKAYADEMVRQAEKAQSQVASNGDSVDAATSELNAAVTAENTAATELSKAQVIATGEQSVANGATAEAMAKDFSSGNIDELTTQLEEQQAIIDGTRIPHPTDKTKTQKASKTKQPTEQQKDAARARISELRQEINTRENVKRAMADEGQALGVLGLTGGESFAQAKAKVMSATLTKDLRDKGMTQHELDNLKESFNNEHAEAVYDSAAFGYARTANNRAYKSSVTLGKKQESYAKAVHATEAAQSRVTNSMKAYSNSIDYAEKLNSTAQGSDHMKQSLKYSKDKEGGLVRNDVSKSNKRRGAASKKLNDITDSATMRSDEGKRRSAVNAAMNATRQNPNGAKELQEAVNSVNGYISGKKSNIDTAIETARTDFENSLTGNNSELVMWDSSTVLDGVGTGTNVNYGRLDANITKHVPVEQRAKVRAAVDARKSYAQTNSQKANFEAAMTSCGNAQLQQRVNECRGADGTYDLEKLDTVFSSSNFQSEYGIDVSQSQTTAQGKAMSKAFADYGRFRNLANQRFNNGYRSVEDLSSMMTNESKTTVGEFAEQFRISEGENAGHINTTRMSRTLHKEYGYSANSEFISSVDSYNASSDRNKAASRQMGTSMSAIDSMQQYHTSLENRGQDIITQYKQTIPQVRTLDRIIASGGNMELTDDMRRVIGTSIGSKNGYYNGTDPTRIVEAATQAREVKYVEQESLLRSGDNLKAEKERSASELTSVLGSALKGMGVSNGNAQKNEQHVHYHNENNNNNINNAAPTGQVNNTQPFFQNVDFSSSSREHEARMREMYNKMQTDGLSHLESVLGTVKQHVEAVEKTTEKIERKVNEDDK